jgi:hypothetical protein
MALEVQPTSSYSCWWVRRALVAPASQAARIFVSLLLRATDGGDSFIKVGRVLYISLKFLLVKRRSTRAQRLDTLYLLIITL